MRGNTKAIGYYHVRNQKAEFERRYEMSWSIDDWFANNGDASIGDNIDDEFVEAAEPWDLSDSE